MALVPSLARAAALENPSGGLFYSGIGVISGWKCEANGELTVRFNGGEPIPLIYGSQRPDVRDAGACASADVGFVAIWNWARLGDGSHTAVAYDDGVEFARGTFQVATLVEDEDFVTGISGRFLGSRLSRPWGECAAALESERPGVCYRGRGGVTGHRRAA